MSAACAGTERCESERCTAMGTPWADSWPRQWRRVVEAEEARLGHRICGARTVQGKPCTVESSHPSGRCRFHGGFDATGAPEGNRNAVRHGLFARSIQRCGPHCPLWKHCPMAGPDIETMPERERPECLYEVQHYESAVRDGLERMGFDLEAGNEDVQGEGRPEGARRVAVHMAALLQMMMLRAATALSVAPMTLMETQGGEKTRHERAKANPSLDAFRRLSGEHRRYFALVCDPGPMIPPPRAFNAAPRSLSDVVAAPRMFEPPPADDAPPPAPPPDTSCEPHRVPDAPDRAIGAATNTASEAPTDGGPGTISDMPVLEISATVEATPEPESALPDCAVLEADATDHSGAAGTGEELEAGEVEVPITDPVETETGPEAGDTAPLADAPTPVAIAGFSPEAMDELLRRAAAEDAVSPRPWAEEDVRLELPGGAARFSAVQPGPPPKMESVKKPSAVLGLFSLREPGSLPPPQVDAVDWPKDAAEQYRWRRLREKITAARVHLAFAEEQAEEDKRRLGGVCGVVLAELKRSREAVARLEEEARETGVPLPRR